jgi:integrase
MASLQAVKGGWRAQVAVAGQRKSRVFATKRAAASWAAGVEVALRAGLTARPGAANTLADAIERYSREVGETQRGWRWTVIRCAAFLRGGPAHPLPLTVRVAEVTPAQLAAWRDARLQVVARGTVAREMTVLRAVFEVARRDWQWIDKNPLADVRRPVEPPARKRTITQHEVRLMLRALGHAPGTPRSVSQAVAVCFLLALRTGMRAGELCSLQWRNVGPFACYLPMTKTGVPRDVPLSAKAWFLIERLRGWDDASVCGLASQTLDALFRRARVRAGLSGFTFHDARHTAATRMAARMRNGGGSAQQAVMDLCKVFGWVKMDQALAYYNPSVAELARRL